MSTKKFKVWYKRPVLTRKQERRLKKLIEEAYGHVAGKRKAILTNTTGGLLQKNQKTHISIPFTPLSKYISEIMHRNHYKREVVIALLRELGVEGERPVETFLYGGCWHGEDPERGDLLFEEKADYAFFSDITGSSRVEYSKRLFYNEVISMGTYLFHTGNLKSLQYNHGSREIRSMKLKLKRGFNKLMRWQSELENKSYKSNDDEIIEK
ncbi:hypothetical protein HY407_04230, partial [Candidatus Gottesmanbacteria bacterium]|nr:hypothetical protein [Candidatus Gottesmanbacteria bacterium]